MVKRIHFGNIPDSIIAINDFESESLDRNEHGGGVGFT